MPIIDIFIYCSINNDKLGDDRIPNIMYLFFSNFLTKAVIFDL